MLFSKYHGLGNDFILIDDRKNSFLISQDYIQEICSRNLGIGADGLVLLQEDQNCDFKMVFFNRDGKEASMCGNALRCLTQFIKDLGFNKKKYLIQTKAYIAEVGFEDNLPYFLAPLPKIIQRNYLISVFNKNITLDIVDSGVKHAILFIKNIKELNVDKIGSYIRKKLDANVNFVEDLDDKLLIRTYEKGVEKETFACATGALACGFLYHLKKAKPNVLISFKEGDIFTGFDKVSKLLGEVKLVFQGKMLSVF